MLIMSTFLDYKFLSNLHESIKIKINDAQFGAQLNNEVCN